MIGFIVLGLLVAVVVYNVFLKKTKPSEQPDFPVDPVIHETPDPMKIAKVRKARKPKEN